MRIVIAIVICVFLGALAFELPGVGLGLLVGLVVGLIWHGRARDKKQAAGAPGATAPAAPQSIEARLAAIEARLARLERGEVALAPAAGAIVPETAGGIPVAAGGAQPAAALSAAGAALREELPPAPPRAPAGPTLIQRLFSGNVFAKLGVLIVFFGVSFAIKWALENELVPVEAWFALAALGGIALLLVGWRLRANVTGYGLILQGGGVGVLYLVTFGALKLYHMLPASLALLLMVAIVVLSAVLAVLQNSLALAAIGVSGGFLAPILASTGGGSHVALFTYYAILNAGIFFIAWFKAWRVLNVLGLVFTVLIAGLWGERYYTRALFASTEPFLLLHFLMYVAIAVLFARSHAPNLKHYVDGTIVFGTPIAAFGIQAAMVHHIEYALAFSALALGLFYLLLATILYSRHRESLRLLVESFFALALIFGTLAIPLALDARWTSAAWALEGAAVLWAGVRQGRLLPRAFGLLLQLGGALAFVGQAMQKPAVADVPLFNSSGLGMLMIALAALFSAFHLHRHGERVTAAERQLMPVVFAWGCLWWLALGISETDRHVPDRFLASAGLAFLAASGAVFSLVSRKLAWPIARWPALLLLPLLLLLALIAPLHPFAGGGWIAWPLALLAHCWLLRRHDTDPDLAPRPDGQTPGLGRRWMGAVHAGTLLLIALLGSWELHWWPAEHGLAHSGWTVAAAMVVPALLLAWVSRPQSAHWPLSAYGGHYIVRAGSVLAGALVAWMWYANLTHDGSSEPLPYLPVLNALDLGHLLAGVALAMWWLRLREMGVRFAADGGAQPLRVLAGVTLFVWLNAILLRTLHHWLGIEYDFDNLWNSLVVQAALSIFWTVLAFALMLYARQRRERLPWMIGAALMGVVVVKLFVADLSNLAGIVRIVAFLGVGALMMLMGYFVPLPPKAGGAPAEQKT